jgi:hypothetical protein
MTKECRKTVHSIINGLEQKDLEEETCNLNNFLKENIHEFFFLHMQLIRCQDLITCRLGCPSCQWIPTRLKSDKDLTKLEIIAIKINRKIIDP